jgi:hypothetical protein
LEPTGGLRLYPQLRGCGFGLKLGVELGCICLGLLDVYFHVSVRCLISWFCACLIGEVVGTSDNPILDTNGLELHALCIAGGVLLQNKRVFTLSSK